MVIGDLGDHISQLPALARWHYDQWGPLTGASSFDGYVALLTQAAASRTVPSVLIAMADGESLGPATLVASDLPPRPDLTPWLAQLFVAPTRRRDGVGAALVIRGHFRMHPFVLVFIAVWFFGVVTIGGLIAVAML